MKKAARFSAVMFACLIAGSSFAWASEQNEPLQTAGKSVFPDNGLTQPKS
ncbi:hypothetical protein OZL92_00515 [Bacillus sonorensis]|uniref:Phosphatase n=1 Tax=Bacillus sonorensis TaxID=119858 RepID=A0ABM6LF30_9BACI|nr:MULTISPECIES: hypothetical protein [Bacillus]TWK74156.1 hypothetical protein CHCC20335_4127 [Bacillus paralicheniformis]ASB87854.1 hypothetical protein S101395_01344 [Bacillus sonorensis]MCF7617188.1 hypothetical protein [Bacillus sonorensis]MCY7859154.1 hypothetical protein [Bacillus sonorensis]MCY8027087.1 hypothetical protein [Bacillus sonorensis]